MMNQRILQLWLFRINFRTAPLLLILTLAASGMLPPWAQAQTYSVLYTFTGSTDGGVPESSVIFDAQSNLYGTTLVSGDVSACGMFKGCGVVYKIDPSGDESVLHTFVGNRDGRQPETGSLLRDSAGNLWGTTQYGGVGGDGIGLGVVYKLAETGKETIVHRFAGGPNDGEEPSGGLIQDKDGTFYGTTAAGGTGADGFCGTMFKISPSGKLTILHNFILSDGCQPTGTLIMDTAGNMYGMTTSGGSANDGTVFKITKAGKVTTLHSFTAEPDGKFPWGILAMDKAGNLYGTTPLGGDPNCAPTYHQGCGIVFEIDTHGKEHILHSFLQPDGGLPDAGVVLDAAGNLYGSTTGYAKYNWGTIFKLGKKGHYDVLYQFTGGADGGLPLSSMSLGEDGNLYGTASDGGVSACGVFGGCGVVFKLTLQ